MNSKHETISGDTPLTITRLRELAPLRLFDLTYFSQMSDHEGGSIRGIHCRGSHPHRPSDFDLNPGLREEIGTLETKTALTPAGVLVAIVAEPQPTVLLCERTEGLRSHGGQIAFPGGKPDLGDNNLADTAIRETYEEIGLEEEFIEPLGWLDPYETRTGYLVHALVAVVRRGYSLKLNPAEVADCFEVPLHFLMTARNHEKHARTWRGKDRYYYAMPFEERYIWGATAGILRNLYERLVLG